MKINAQNIANIILITLFMVLLPTYIVYDFLKDSFKDVAKINREELLIVSDEEMKQDSVAEKLMDSLESAAIEKTNGQPKEIKDSIKRDTNIVKIKRRTPEEIEASRIRDRILERKLDSIYRYNQKFASKMTGEKVSILITGIDSRLGSNTKHADANHLVNVYFNTGFIEIITIPRGTLANANFDDSTRNYLANVRSNRGHKIYMKEVSRISGVHKIDYFVEFGFSEAIGLMELLGYKGRAVKMLRMLRHRKSFGIGDWQRAYNQGQFIRQMILNVFPKLDELGGDIMLRGGLYLVRSDLNMTILNKIIKRLGESGFPRNRSDVIVRMKPRYAARCDHYKRYDFTDKTSRDSLYNRLSNYASRIGLKEEPNNVKSISDRVFNTLNSMILSVESDTLNNPSRVIKTLRKPYSQKAWLQIADTARRYEIRDIIGRLLISSFKNKRNPRKADSIEEAMRIEREVLK